VSKGLRLIEAARALKVDPSTLRRWVAAGCPCLEEGTVGRNHGAILDLDVVSRWRAERHDAVSVQRQNADLLAIIASALIDSLKRDGAHKRVDITEGQASGLLALAYKRIWQNLTRQPVDEFVSPPEIAHLCAIWLQYTEDPNSLRR
jgi:hypothetical protein